MIIGLFQSEIAGILPAAFTLDFAVCDHLAQCAFDSADAQRGTEFPDILLGESSELVQRCLPYHLNGRQLLLNKRETIFEISVGRKDRAEQILDERNSVLSLFMPAGLRLTECPGDVWTLGRHRMVCGDSTNPDHVDLLMDGLKANLVVTDPPYNVAYESADGKSIQNDSMADEKFYEFLLAAFRNMAAHMAEGGSAYIFHADTEGLNFRRAFKEAGFHISGVCIWVKNSLVLGRSPYQWQHEPVLFGWMPNGKHRWFSDRKQTTIWNFDKPKHSKEHPTMKPIPLLAYPIKNSSAPNGVVLDLFGGSGSTLMACEQTDRICRTMELDPRYASVIVQRYVDSVGADGVKVLRDGCELTYSEVTA